MLLTHSYSVPKNGTPSLTANYKIIQALMGYATISAYGALSTLSTTIICFVLRVNTGQIIQRSKMKQNCSFVATAPSTRAGRFIGALDHYDLGLTKPATFLRLRFPGHERACSRIHEASPVLRATIVYRHLLYTYTRGQSTK